MSSYRSNSGSKWKEVLGFDDGMSSCSSPTASSGYTYVERRDAIRQFPSPSQLIYPRFPRDITFFRSRSDILLSPSSPIATANDDKLPPQPPHLFYITLQRDPSTGSGTGRPDILLHSGPNKANTVISFTKFHSVTQAIDITLCPTPPKPVAANFSSTNFSNPSRPPAWLGKGYTRPKFSIERLTPTGGVFTTEKFAFYHTIPGTTLREKFEWRYTALGAFTRDVSKESGGLKLVRVDSGDVVAVYAGLGHVSKASSSTRVMGMFRFLRGDGMVGLSEEFEVLAIMSILSISERNRRTAKAQRKAFMIE